MRIVMLLLLAIFSCLAAPVLSGAGANAIVDVLIDGAKEKISRMGYAHVDLRPYFHDLPKEVSDPEIYDLTTLRRIGDVYLSNHTYANSTSTVYLEVSIGLSELTFQCKGSLYHILHGKIRVFLHDNAVTVGMLLKFEKGRCTYSLQNTKVRMRGVDVSASGFTFLVNPIVKHKVRSTYDDKVDMWEDQIVSEIEDRFSQMEYKWYNPFCDKLYAILNK